MRGLILPLQAVCTFTFTATFFHSTYSIAFTPYVPSSASSSSQLRSYYQVKRVSIVNPFSGGKKLFSVQY
jgi:hypothetical protein